jgi:hypothetical protein
MSERITRKHVGRRVWLESTSGEFAFVVRVLSVHPRRIGAAHDGNGSVHWLVTGAWRVVEVLD